ncbi:MAG TPA: integrase family protein [Thermoanaerobaculia bacterium]|nr:integrase family protein [Thermoanaerobaculia bacterium]
MTEKLTKRIIDRLVAEADPGRDTLVWDQEVPGLILRLRYGGARFAFQYKHHGRTRRISLGTYGGLTLDEARKLARELYVDVRSGGDPATAKREARRKRPTFAEAAELYLEDLRDRAAAGAVRGKLSTAAEFERLLRRHILPAIGTREVESLALPEIEAMHRSLRATPRQANAAITVTSAVLGFAERRRLRPQGVNPCRLVQRLKERAKRRRLTLLQMAALGQALRAAEAAGEGSSPILAIRLLALTGLRRSELVGHPLKVRRTEGSGLRWGDVDLQARSLDLRDAKAGARIAPIGRAAVEALRRAKPEGARATDYVCPGERPDAPFIGLDKPARRLFVRAGVEAAGVHALRRTYASLATEMGFPDLLVAALLGHHAGGVTAGYVMPELDPLRAAADRVSSVIAAQLDGRELAPVVRIDDHTAWR